MTSQEHSQNDNPLDEYAASASHELSGRVTDVNNSSVARIESGQVALRESFAQHVHASAAYMEDAAAGVVNTGALEAKGVAVGVALANTVHADTLQAGVLAARQLEGNEIHTGLLLAVDVRGNVYSTLSPLAGLAIGAGFAATLMLINVAIKAFGHRRVRP